MGKKPEWVSAANVQRPTPNVQRSILGRARALACTVWRLAEWNDQHTADAIRERARWKAICSEGAANTTRGACAPLILSLQIARVYWSDDLCVVPNNMPLIEIWTR